MYAVPRSGCDRSKNSRTHTSCYYYCGLCYYSPPSLCLLLPCLAYALSMSIIN